MARSRSGLFVSICLLNENGRPFERPSELIFRSGRRLRRALRLRRLYGHPTSVQFGGQRPLRLNVEQQMPFPQQREGVTANLVAPLMSGAQIADPVAASGRLRDNMPSSRLTRKGEIDGPLADPARQPVRVR
jgi:hypothetical protein